MGQLYSSHDRVAAVQRNQFLTLGACPAIYQTPTRRVAPFKKEKDKKMLIQKLLKFHLQNMHGAGVDYLSTKEILGVV